MTVDTAIRTQRILVVDDIEQNRLLAETILESSGYAVTLAGGADEGLARFREDPYDLVLLDIGMPGKDGFDACREVRLLPGGGDVPIVFLTAAGEFGAHHRAIEVGADDFLTKPINRTELLLRVRSLLRLKTFKDQCLDLAATTRAQQASMQQAETQKQELIDFIVHDLKSRLAGVMTAARHLAALPTLPEAAQEPLLEITTSGESMHVMVQNMLDLSHSRSGSLAVDLQPCDLGAMLTHLSRLLGRRVVAKQQQLTLPTGLAGLQVSADPNLLSRVLATLLEYASRATPVGGHVGVEVTAGVDGYVTLRVNDEGPCIPPTLQRYVFDPPTPQTAPVALKAGRSLGLVFCRMAVTAQGGLIWVEDRQPQGCSFCLRLPMAG
jgi:DNA-binding response OmpR family regulator